MSRPIERRLYLAAAFAAAGNRVAVHWDAVEIRALPPAVTTERWLRTDPMTDAKRRQRPDELLAHVALRLPMPLRLR